MTTRWYLVDIVITAVGSGNYRSPAHFGGRMVEPDAPLAGVVFNPVDYGAVPVALVVAQVDVIQEAYLDGLSDVLVVPPNIDDVIGTGRLTTVQNALKSKNIPGAWIASTDTYKEVLRQMVGFFNFMRRVTALTGINPFTLSINLQTRYNSLPALWKNAILQAGIDGGYDTSGLAQNPTLTQILRSITAQDSLKQFKFGSVVL